MIPLKKTIEASVYAINDAAQQLHDSGSEYQYLDDEAEFLTSIIAMIPDGKEVVVMKDISGEFNVFVVNEDECPC